MKFCWTAALLVMALSSTVRSAERKDEAHFRKPVAIALSGDRVVVANERSGSLSLLSGKDLTVLDELPIGKGLSDVVCLSDGSLLVTDLAAHELIAVRWEAARGATTRRLAVSPYPVKVRVSSDEKQAFVAGLWSRTVTIVNLSAWREAPIGGGPLSAADRVKIVRPIALTFAPRELLSIEESSRLIVADAFGSKLAVINVENGLVESIRDIPAHGIRQLRIHPAKPRLMFTHQMLNRMAPTTQDDVHWGGVMVNCLRSLPLTEVLNPTADPIKASLLDYLGGPEHGAGDPAGFVIRADGTAAVALSGTNEVAFDDGNRLYSRRVEVGVCPTAITMAADGRRAYVANTLSDSISLLDMNERRLVQTVPLGPTPDLTATDRGERLFHDSRLSHDRWFSCASCHIDGHTSGQLNDNKTDATFGTAKRVLTLRGVADTAPYAWNGRFATLGQQIRHSVLSTMQGEELSDAQVDDLESYLKTLPPPPAAGATDPVATKRGAALFQRLDCSRCHKEPVFTTPRVVDVKLSDERGQSRYNPPSLRGVSQNGPYFHDGRASSLQEVLGHFQHQLPVPLTDDEIQDLIEYLKTL